MKVKQAKYKRMDGTHTVLQVLMADDRKFLVYYENDGRDFVVEDLEGRYIDDWDLINEVQVACFEDEALEMIEPLLARGREEYDALIDN